MLRLHRLKKLALPPAGPLFAAIAGSVLYRVGLEPLGLTLIAVGILTLYLISAPVCGRLLLAPLDRYPALDPASPQAQSTGAIVILDAGRRSAPPEQGGDAVTPRTLERLTAGAELYRSLERPVLVSGDGAHELMAEMLDHLFHVPVRWVERESRNTRENALYSARLLRAEGIESVALVTHFWHMPRAANAFRRAGLEVVPAPMGFTGRLRSESGWMAWVPSARALFASYLGLHEWIGIVWYRLRYT